MSETPMTPEAARVRLAQYGERTRAYGSGTERALYEIALTLLAEADAYAALGLGDLDGRVSASCPDPAHPTWLARGDVGSCPWCQVAAQDRVIATQLRRVAERDARLGEAAVRVGALESALSQLCHGDGHLADEDPIAYSLTARAAGVRVEEDVTPQVLRLRARLAEQRRQAGESS